GQGDLPPRRQDASLRSGGGGDGCRAARRHRQSRDDHRPGLAGTEEGRAGTMTSVASTAPASLLVRRPEGPLLRFLFWSALVHAVLFSTAIVWAKLHEEPAIDLDQKPIKAPLVRQGTPRDEKLLPRIEQPPPPPVEQKAPEPVPVPEPPRTVAPAPVAPPAPPKAKQAGEKKADTRQQLLAALDPLRQS